MLNDIILKTEVVFQSVSASGAGGSSARAQCNATFASVDGYYPIMVLNFVYEPHQRNSAVYYWVKDLGSAYYLNVYGGNGVSCGGSANSTNVTAYSGEAGYPASVSLNAFRILLKN